MDLWATCSYFNLFVIWEKLQGHWHLLQLCMTPEKAPDGPSLLPFNIPILAGVSKNVDLGVEVIIS